MHLLFRVLYRALRARAAVAAAAFVVRALRAVGAGRAADAVLGRLTMALGYSGWPGRSPVWVNLDGARFARRVAHRAQSRRRVRARRPRRDADPVRVGLLGPFGGMLMDVAPLVAHRPRGVECHVFDIEFRGRSAPYLAERAASYHALAEPATRASRVAAVREIGGAELDLLVVFVAGAETYLLLDEVDTPVVAYACTGSDLLYHDRVAYNLYAQPQADYFEHDGRVFCGTSRAFFGDEVVIPAFLLFDLRGIEPGAGRSWHEREPTILFHGSLYKAAQEPFLDAIAGVLADVPEAELVLFGRDVGGALDAIRDRARRRGIGGRLRFEGGFSALRADDGTLADEGWDRVRAALETARLAPDPFPLGGASARFEAYALGVPTVHLAVRFDPPTWGKPQHAEIDQPALSVPSTTVTTPAAYRASCVRALTDPAFAARVVDEQLEIARRVTDPLRYWQQLLDGYGRALVRRA